MAIREKKRVQIQIDADIAEKAEGVISELGMTPTTAITMFYKRIIANDGIPFNLTITEDEKLTRSIQYYSSFISMDVLDTKEEIAEWLNDDDWE